MHVAFPGVVPGKNREAKGLYKLKALKEVLAFKEGFIFPVHWGNNHWFVVKGNRTMARWEAYDSIANTKATSSVVEVQLIQCSFVWTLLTYLSH